MLEVAAAFDGGEGRATVGVGLLSRFLRQGINALDIAAVVLVRVGAERLDGLAKGARRLACLARRVDRIAVVFADEHHGELEQGGGIDALPEDAALPGAAAEEGYRLPPCPQ